MAADHLDPGWRRWLESCSGRLHCPDQSGDLGCSFVADTEVRASEAAPTSSASAASPAGHLRHPGLGRSVVATARRPGCWSQAVHAAARWVVVRRRLADIASVKERYPSTEFKARDLPHGEQATARACLLPGRRFGRSATSAWRLTLPKLRLWRPGSAESFEQHSLRRRVVSGTDFEVAAPPAPRKLRDDFQYQASCFIALRKSHLMRSPLDT